MTNTKDENNIYGFKAFNKGLICQNKQYEVGKTYQEKGETICKKGMMHFCQTPFDIFNYYPLLNEKAELIDFCKVSTPKDKVITDGDKSATTELTILDKLTLKDLINNQVFTLSSLTNGAHSATTGYGAHSATTGDEAHSATTGYKAHSATTGNNTIAAALGNYSMASASIGSWIVLAEYDDNENIRFVKTAKIDGKKLKPNVLYTLKNGRFVKGAK